MILLVIFLGRLGLLTPESYTILWNFSSSGAHPMDAKLTSTKA